MSAHAGAAAPPVTPAAPATAVPIARGLARTITRWRAFAPVAVKMMFHDKLKMFGTLVGVLFAVILSNQQLGTFLGLLSKNTMYVDNGGADLWIVPPPTTQFLAVDTMPDSTVLAARTLDGVVWASPVIVGQSPVKNPTGGFEAVTLIGVELPERHGGPWNMVAGSADALELPDAVILEDSQREKFGNADLGSVREISGRKMTVAGFTWGLLPFGPSYAFTEFTRAREILGVENYRVHFVLVKIKDPANLESAKRDLQARVPDQLVLTTREFDTRIVKFILTRTPIGITFGTSAAFGLIVGFVIVALTMFSAIVDNVREFGTLKAIGATTRDLAKLLFVQSVIYATMGYGLGIFLVANMARGIRSPNLALRLPPALILGTYVLVVLLCIFASSLSLIRLRKVEPAMVFRG